MIKDVVKKVNGINVRVSYCLELLGVIYKLSEYEDNKERNNKKYRDDIDTYFYDFKNHIVIKKFKIFYFLIWKFSISKKW